MSNSDELLQRIVSLLEETKSEQLAFRQDFEAAIDAAKTRDERIRGELRALQGSVTSLSGDVDRLNGNVIVLGAVVEELERTDRRIFQGMDGLTQLTKTNFDQNASILEELTGTKGADRPQRITRPSNPG